MILAESFASPWLPKDKIPETILVPVPSKDSLFLFHFNAGCSPESQMNAFILLKLVRVSFYCLLHKNFN